MCGNPNQDGWFGAAQKKQSQLYPEGREKIDTVFNFAKVTNPDLDFGDAFKVLDLGVDSQGRVIAGQVKAYPWGNSNIRIDSMHLDPLDMQGMTDLLDTFIHEAIHRGQSFVDQTVREPITHPQVGAEANNRTNLLRKSFEGHIRSVYQ